MIKPSDRISGFQPYFFATLNQKINQLRQNGMDVIRMDMGSPDLPPDSSIVDALVSSARNPHNHGYAQIGGNPNFKKAVVEYYHRRHEVDLDPNREVLALIGSKEGLFNLSQVILNPGDISLVPDPGYPVYSSSALIAGAEVYPLPLLEKNGFLPDLAAIPEDIRSRAKLLWLNYPNNPTGAVANLDYFRQVIDYAKSYDILVAHDAPYMDVCFDGYRAPSLLEVEGAKEVAVEFNSLSKTYNMGGWRIGMVVGNPEVIRYLHTYKSQADSSTFTPIMDAGASALTGDQDWLAERNAEYKTRRDLILNPLRNAGFSVVTPQATIYIWARLPGSASDSVAYCKRLLEETGVSFTPGVVYGQYGEGFIRISLGTPTSRVEEAMARFAAWEAKNR